MSERFDFARVLAPCSAETFFAEHWERKPLLIERGEPRYYEPLLTLDDVDFILTTHLHQRDFAISILGVGAAKRTPSSLTVSEVYDYFRRGGSIRIGAMFRFLEPLRPLVASFESTLGSRIGVNMYLTPKNAKAFGRHYDSHDVYVLQIAGLKHWRIYDPPVELPLENTFPGRSELFGVDPPYAPSFMPPVPFDSMREITLRAGDMLYLPRGVKHEAVTTDSLSMHLTVAAPAITWYEVFVHALKEAALDAPELRGALRPPFGDGEEGLAARIDALARELTPERLRKSVSAIAAQFALTREPYHSGLLARIDRADELTLESRLCIAPDLVIETRIEGVLLYLMFSGQFVELPLRTESMIRFILETRAFRVAELPTAMDDQSRVLLARILVENGFLVSCP